MSCRLRSPCPPPDTLLAYAMNGDVLPPDHGFPLRAVVLGWVGSSSIKWLGQIQVSTEPPLDAQQLDVLCADRRRLPRRGRSSRSRGDDPDHQERVGIVVARGPFGRSASDLRLCTVTARSDRKG